LIGILGVAMFDVVDAQLHAWLPDSPEHPWDPGYGKTSKAQEHVGGYMSTRDCSPRDLITVMDSVGVNAAVLTSPGVYGDDSRIALAAARDWPDRFGVIARVNPESPTVEDQLASFRTQPDVLGVRLTNTNAKSARKLETGAYRRFFAAAESFDLPTMIYPPGYLPAIDAISREHPNLRLIIDHLGLPQPPGMEKGPEPFHGIARADEIQQRSC
jgi:predicted TIM-barrel fold metal-dependent hydrolase